jgi:DNA-binding NtrC family response regulator
MVTVNTASIPETVFESELFGHVAGAFTDAKKDRIGRFELAHEGTLFLDEIATVPLLMQSKLLRVVESGAFERIGSSKTSRVDARILSATNADLDEEVAQGRFRQDLLYRLNTVVLRIPPLRDRREDIALLANYFLQRYVTKYRKEISGFASSTIQMLLDHPWPGNVRELDHAIERAVLMSPGECLHASDLGLTTREQSAPEFERLTIEDLERWALRKALERSDGDISKAAAALALSRAALYRRLEKYGMGGDG